MGFQLDTQKERRIIVQTLPRPETGSPLGLGRGIKTLVNAPALKELNNKQSNTIENNRTLLFSSKKDIVVYAVSSLSMLGADSL